MKIADIKRLKCESNLLGLINKSGIPRNQIEVIKDEFADRKAEKGEKYYYYDGPLDEKTRPFCSQLLKMDKVISEIDIEILSTNLNYDVLKYEGSYNCRHKWVRFRGKRISTPEITNRQISDLIIKGISG